MSGIGFWELIILFLIGLIVLGPERLPRVANQIGGWLGQARRMTRVMKRQLEDELNFEKDLGPGEASPSKPGVSNPQYVHDKSAEHDDSYSPQHDAGSVGSGVTDERTDVSVDEAVSSPSDEDSDSSAANTAKKPAA